MNCTNSYISNNDIINISFGIYYLLISIYGIINFSYLYRKIINKKKLNKCEDYKLYDQKWFDINKYEPLFKQISEDKNENFYIYVEKINDNNDNNIKMKKSNDSTYIKINVNIFYEIDFYKPNTQHIYENKEKFREKNKIDELNLETKYCENDNIHKIYKYKIENLYKKITQNNNKLYIKIYEKFIIITNLKE